MALGLWMICIIAVLTRNAQAIIAKDSEEEDVAFELELGEHPWLALLEVPGGEFCSGTIVSPTALLSAAVCLRGATRPTHGVAYAGNVKYREPKDFAPPTQNRSVVQYHLYDENNTAVYNIMLVKIFPQWTWSCSVQPIGVIDMERLPEHFAAECYVSGLGGPDDSKVAHHADVWMSTWRACARAPQHHRMCFDDSGILAPRAGDLGGPVLCDYEPKDKLYGIISEDWQSTSGELLDTYKIPSHVNGFQYVGFYLPWINKTAGDLLSEEEMKIVRLQNTQDLLRPLENGLFPAVGRVKRDNRDGTGPNPAIDEPAGNATGAPPPTTPASGAALLSAGAWPLLPLLLAALC